MRLYLFQGERGLDSMVDRIPVGPIAAAQGGAAEGLHTTSRSLRQDRVETGANGTPVATVADAKASNLLFGKALQMAWMTVAWLRWASWGVDA